MSRTMIAVVDYKAGNLTSVMKALASVGAGSPAPLIDAVVTADPEVVRRADKIMLPGVGHFAATRLLDEQGLTAAIREKTQAGTAFLGICVGLQWLFEGSTEAPSAVGLGAFPGACERFSGPAFERSIGARNDSTESELKCPHVGWNSLRLVRATPLTAGVEDGAFVYYTHAYRAPIIYDTVAVTHYGADFSAIVARDNVMGVQFHPEKSGAAGLRLLENFVRL